MSEESSLIYNKALDILSRREHSAKELIFKLEKKFDSTEEIFLTVSKLKKIIFLMILGMQRHM